MDTYSKLYWLTRLDGIHGLFICLYIAAFLYSIVTIIAVGMGRDFDSSYDGETVIARREVSRKKYLSKIKFVLPTGILFVLLSVFMPTKNEAIFIVAGAKTIDFIQTDTSINKIPSQTTTLISNFLENQIKEMKGDTAKKK